MQVPVMSCSVPAVREHSCFDTAVSLLFLVVHEARKLPRVIWTSARYCSKAPPRSPYPVLRMLIPSRLRMFSRSWLNEEVNGRWARRRRGVQSIESQHRPNTFSELGSGCESGPSLSCLSSITTLLCFAHHWPCLRYSALTS